MPGGYTEGITLDRLTEIAPMDAVAKFASAPRSEKARRGPLPRCDIYGKGDPELYRILHARRADGETWAAVQKILDGVLGIEQPVKADHFRYHWSGKCAHWDDIEIPE